MSDQIKSIQQKGSPLSLVLSGKLNVQNSVALRKELLEYREKEPVLQVALGEVEDLDLSFLQLLLALQKSQEQNIMNAPLTQKLNEDQQLLLQIAGLHTIL